MTVWVVDYDLPEGNERRRFYRAVQAYLIEKQGSGLRGWSTQSVVITEDQEFAEFVYEQASQLGRAHMYRGEQIK